VKSTVLISRNVADTLLEEAETEKADLLILGWRGTSGRGRIFGSNIDRVVEKANCDVIVFKSEGLKEPVGRILVLAGAEWHSSYAAEIASVIAKSSGAEVTVLGIAQADSQTAAVRGYSGKLVKICETKGVKAKEKILVTKNLINTVINESDDYDLLVLGASEVVWAPSMVLIGMAEDRIAKGTGKPVLMVRKVKKVEKPAKAVKDSVAEDGK
jgi:nucleotide-binding universal stress UspA family protein